ncbi:MATE family efflux transporter [Ferrimonas senticii]|uniref:MATE family efflux transporter n=1 Tax=Ferrimonas senticii TaxID=394566 RepID=UPI001F0AAC95|nr:MATE family efflux transporter [Ferrimonas senticii]
MTSSNLLAVLSLLAYQLTDAYFISRLGADPLAAFGLTLAPTLMVVAIALGCGSALSVNVARLLGRGDLLQARRFVSHSLLFTGMIAVLLCGFGMISIDWQFQLLGAEGALLPLYYDYIWLWYLGAPLLVLQIQANQALRAAGYSFAPALVTTLIAVTNAILDPLLIFGIGPFPELGLQGAALATVLAWLLSSATALALLLLKYRLAALPQPPLLLQHWRELLHIARPCTASNLLNPLASATLIAMLARIDTHAVAAFGVGMRIEGVMLILVTALSGTLTPFLALNLSSGQHQRAFHALFGCLKVVLLVQLALYLLVWFANQPLTGLFAIEAATGHYLSQFLLWLPASYGLLGMVILLSVLLNAEQQPMAALALNIVRLGLLLPAAWLGQRLGGAEGIFIAMASANCLAGVLCWQIAKRRACRYDNGAALQQGLS